MWDGDKTTYKLTIVTSDFRMKTFLQPKSVKNQVRLEIFANTFLHLH